MYNEPRFVTREAQDIFDRTMDEQLAQDHDQLRLARADQVGQAALIQRHPNAARPEVMARVGMEIATNADKYRSRLVNESAAEVYEDAYARVMTQGSPADDLGRTTAVGPRDFADR